MRKLACIVVLGVLAACGQQEQAKAPETPAATPSRVADWAQGYLNKPLTESFPQSTDACRGSADVIFERYPGGGVRLRGWAWNRAASAPYETVLATNPEGVVIGAGMVSLDRPDVVRGYPQEINTPQVGYELLTDTDAASITAYGVDRATNTACRLATIDAAAAPAPAPAP